MTLGEVADIIAEAWREHQMSQAIPFLYIAIMALVGGFIGVTIELYLMRKKLEREIEKLRDKLAELEVKIAKLEGRREEEK